MSIKNHADTLTELLLSKRAIKRWEAVGSLRRTPDVATQIDLLVEPVIDRGLMQPLPSLEGYIAEHVEPIDRLAGLVHNLALRHEIAPLKPTPRYGYWFRYQGWAVRLHTCIPPQQWGMQLALLSSGPVLERKMRASRKHGGLLPNGWKLLNDGVLVDGHDAPQSAPDEEAWFALLNLPFLPLQHRR